MKTSAHSLLLLAMLSCLCVPSFDALAQEDTQTAQAQTPPPEDSDRRLERQQDDDDSFAAAEEFSTRFARRHGDSVILHIGDDSYLGANESADAVISIFGSATSEGEVDEVVVSVFGNTRVTGPVREGAVSIFGNTYIDSEIGHDAVAVFGDVELGPNAYVRGDVVAVGGAVVRDPGAIVRGSTQEIFLGEGFGRAEWLRQWFQQCLLYGRPLAFEPGLGWAWGIAFGFLGFYILIALLFGGAVEKCVETLETQPGQSAVASLLTVLLTPVLMFLLLITVIGIGLMPFVGMGLFVAGLFGKAVILAALGRRVTRFTGIVPFSHIAFGVLVGGVIVLGLYVVPVLGFIAYKVIGILGLGVVIYTLILAIRSRREAATAQTSVAMASAAAMAGAAAAGEPGGAQGPAGPGATPSEPAPVPPTGEAPPVTPETALPRAGFWIRMAALLIDAILVSVIISILEPSGEFALVALAAYGALMWKLKGTTIGGIVCNIKVVRTDGREINWDTAIVRALSCFLSLIPAGLGFLWIVFDDERQSWHDKIAGTLVVRTPRSSSLL